MPTSSTPPNNLLPLRFSLRQALVLVLVACICLAAWRANNPVWTAALNNLNIALLLAAAVTAIYARGPLRAFAIGFLIANGFFTLIEFVPSVGETLVHRMLSWQLFNPGARHHLAFGSNERACVVSLLT